MRSIISAPPGAASGESSYSAALSNFGLPIAATTQRGDGALGNRSGARISEAFENHLPRQGLIRQDPSKHHILYCTRHTYHNHGQKNFGLLLLQASSHSPASSRGASIHRERRSQTRPLHRMPVPAASRRGMLASHPTSTDSLQPIHTMRERTSSSRPTASPQPWRSPPRAPGARQPTRSGRSSTSRQMTLSEEKGLQRSTPT